MSKIHERSLVSYWLVMPQDCNHHLTASGKMMMHGGHLLQKMDLYGYMAVRRAAYGATDPEEPIDFLTIGGGSFAFHIGPAVGDLLVFEVVIVKLGIKSITVDVTCYRENQQSGNREIVATQSGLAFVCIDKRSVTRRHNLTFEE